MYLDDVPMNYLGVLLAAIVYFIIGFIWYAPFAFGSKRERHDDKSGTPTHAGCSTCKSEPGSYACKIGSYIGEFIIALIIAYVLALFIQISQADEVVEGIAVALWIWVGFIATTHFSSVLWARKTLEHFFIHAGFMLVGLIAMGAVIMYMGF
jgi:hypothetical protein